MLTKERIGKSRKLKYAAVALALIAVLVFCFTSCGKVTPTAIEYVAGTAQKVEYNQGEIFDCTGAKIKVTYDNGLVEEKAVTTEMVGNAPLSLGVTAVSVTYSEEGVTIVGSIPVTVKDPYSALRVTAKEALETNADVVANPEDKGIATLINDYKAKIDAAAGEDAINLVVSNFQDALTTYLAAKAAILEQINDPALLEGLYAQYLLNVQAKKAVAVDTVKAASTVKEAENVLESFKLAVKAELDVQKFYEDENKDIINGNVGGQIGDKIDILTFIDEYAAKVEFLKDIVTTAFAKNEITKTAHDFMMYMSDGGNKSYQHISARLTWWENYITLAIDLDVKTVKDTITKEIDALIKTPIDELSALLAKGTTVYTIKYATDEATGKFIDGADATGDLLKKIEGYLTDATAKFGATGVQTLVEAYGVAENGAPYLYTIRDLIQAKYNTLTTIRENAKPLIDLIDAIPEGTGANVVAALDAAWAAYRAWGETDVNGTVVFAVNKTITNTYDNIRYDKTFEGTFKSTMKDGRWTNSGTWSTYAIDVAKIIKVYFVPNLQKLLDATYALAAAEVAATIDSIPEIILSYTDKVADAGDEITAAEMAISAFSTTYPSDVFLKYFDSKTGIYADKVAEVAAARVAYGQLIEKAALANEAIEKYAAAIDYANKGVANVVRSDYENKSTEIDNLFDAYTLYCDFAKANTNSKGVVFTDVIEYSNETTKSGNETKLVACMDRYVALAYAEERHVQSDMIINAAWLDREDNIDLNETDFRTALQNYKQGEIDKISTDAAYNYNKTGATNFNYDEILAKNLEVVKAAAKVIADKVTAATFENGALKFN